MKKCLLNIYCPLNLWATKWFNTLWEVSESYHLWLLRLKQQVMIWYFCSKSFCNDISTDIIFAWSERMGLLTRTVSDPNLHCIFSTSRLQINWTTRSQEEWPRAPSIFSEYCETGELQLNIESMDQDHWNSYGLVFLPRGYVIFSNRFPGVEIKSTFLIHSKTSFPCWG